MARKHDLDNIDLSVDDVEIWINKELDMTGMTISWSSKIGFGEYQFYKHADNKWHADTETMDHGEDKAFGEKLLSLFLQSVTIDG